LFTEGGQKGFWTTAYSGTTNLTTVEADLFAKFATNGYFTLSLEANSSKNSITDGKIPYVPDVQLRAGLSFEVLRGLRLLPTLSVTDHRIPDLLATHKMNSYLLLGLRGEYSALRGLDVFIDFQNLTDTVYEEWNGYRATPFVVSAGISCRW
jgi:outer membrane receptor protein involved in Fe transport